MRISFQCVALNGTNKVGNLQKDSKGYYEMVLGSLNAFNSAGWRYSLEHARPLFDQNEILMRRIRAGRLRGETGHPRFQPGMSQLQWFNRVEDLYEPNLCTHINQVDLSHDSAKDDKGRPITLIIGRVKPSGANSAWLEKQLDNPEEDVCYSIRSFTQDMPINGVPTKCLKKIVTWDTVSEPGMKEACKYNTPSLESMVPSGQLIEASEFEFDTQILRREVERMSSIQTPGQMTPSFEGANMFNLISEIERPIKVYMPAVLRWK